MLEKTTALLNGWKVGDPAPEVAYDDGELNALGNALRRLLFSPPALRRRLQELGVTITPANFYSEIPTIADIELSFAGGIPQVYDQGFDHDRLVGFLETLMPYGAEFDPPVQAEQGYCWKGGPFSYSDAMSYYCMVRHVKPDHIVEIGSGWSTLVADMAIRRNGFGRITCIEPFPPEFLAGIDSVGRIHRGPVQGVAPATFNDMLKDGDILFIDSTHTVKHASDCLHIYLRVLPALRASLMIHAHDIYLPEPQPVRSLRDLNQFWTEQYLLYAYLLGNPRAKIVYGSLWHLRNNRQMLTEFMHGRHQPGGASFWFQQLGLSDGLR